jgi:hypothetical protein
MSEQAHDEYNDEQALNEYLTWNYPALMTDAERRSLDLALKREKALSSDVAAGRLPKWLAAAGAEAVENSRKGARALAVEIGRRIQRDVWAGRIVVNRCPSCSRIVKTPLARQCLWCGHDWHA